MRLLVSAAFVLVLVGSPCRAADEDLKDNEANSSGALHRVDKLVHQFARTLSELTSDVLPVMKAVGEEATREVQSDLPKIGRELANQLRHLMPAKKDRD